ncbi:hypothetical protein RRF57_001666 [Xylaria bambusicola]|uniref:Uncharacterized protein n=1 Tax=Xylaria bambusicola TaxID=326684 RepID=A0AAN7U589_9PEZI
MDGEACPSDDLFSPVVLSHYEKPPLVKNELMRDALRMSLLLGHRSADSSLGQTTYAPYFDENKSQDHETSGKAVAINVEALLSPEGRQWNESFKRIPSIECFQAPRSKVCPRQRKDGNSLRMKWPRR